MFAFGALGVLLASIDPKAGGDLLRLISASAPATIVVPFLLFIAVGEVWANYLDVYTAGLSGLALNLRVRRWTASLAPTGRVTTISCSRTSTCPARSP